jgi:hypothetical protein
MLQRAMQQLRGAAVLGREGPLGTLDDLYFDAQHWQVRYVVVAGDSGLRAKRLLVSAACLARATALDRVRVDLSRAQMRSAAGAWPLEAAARWLDRTRICSSRDTVGFRIEAQDGIAGRLADLLVDDQEWSIDYMIVDTGPAPAGKQHLLAPLDWVSGMHHERRAMRVERTCRELGEVKAA